MQFAGGSEEDEDQEATSDFSNPFEEIQVYRTARSIQETIISGCFPT